MSKESHATGSSPPGATERPQVTVFSRVVQRGWLLLLSIVQVLLNWTARPLGDRIATDVQAVHRALCQVLRRRTRLVAPGHLGRAGLSTVTAEDGAQRILLQYRQAADREM